MSNKERFLQLVSNEETGTLERAKNRVAKRIESAIPAVKSGRCFNGSERDRGSVVHLVTPLHTNDFDDWFTRALCGTEPGRRGNGWSKSYSEATCPKCLKNLETIKPKVKALIKRLDK